MLSQETKRKSKVRILLGILVISLGIGAVSVGLRGNVVAGDEEEVIPETNDEQIVVTGVANTVEYLTSLYLYTHDPYAETSVVLKYDPELNALVVNSAIDASAMGIGFNDYGEGVVGSVFVGGTKNRIYYSSEGIYNEYEDQIGSQNAKDDSAVVIGGYNNRPGALGSVIIGGENGDVHFFNSTMIGSKNSSLGGHHSVALGAVNSSLNVQDWSSLLIGTNNHGDKFTFLIGSGIDTHGGAHWSMAVGSVFVWSDDDEGFPIHGGGLGGQAGFYVNAENGFGLNTSTPRLMFDFRSAGPLKIIESEGGITERTLVISEGNGIECIQSYEGAGEYAGTVAYVKANGAAGFCGCNGYKWVPLSYDAVTQYVCADQSVKSKKCEGRENIDGATVIFHTGTEGLQRWDEELNNGAGDWFYPGWTFGGIPSILTGGARECVYYCNVGYHPGELAAQGWMTGSCIACTPILHGQHISPGTGMDDCDFACDGGYKYDPWSTGYDTKCVSCPNGEWSLPLNQETNCKKCHIPMGISAGNHGEAAGAVFYSGSIWVPTEITGILVGEPYVKKFTTPGSGNEYACNFDCMPGFMYQFDGTQQGNMCVECSIGTYSAGGKAAYSASGCPSCKNKPGAISYQWNDGTRTYTDTLTPEQVSHYTSKGTGEMNCEWECNTAIGLVKEGNTCKCPEGSHLENKKCVSNIMGKECQGNEPDKTAVKGQNFIEGKVTGNGTRTNWTWSANSYKWTAVANPDGNTIPGGCQWTCPKDYTQTSNGCTPPKVGKCSSRYNNIALSYGQYEVNENYVAGRGCDGDGTYQWGSFNKLEINYFWPRNTQQFQFLKGQELNYATNRMQYAVTWKCNGYNNDDKYSSNCFAYFVGPKTAGLCKDDQRTDGKADPQCATDFAASKCNEELSCPPIQKIEDARSRKGTTSHGKTWICPGVFGGQKSPQCHACDTDYSWWKKNSVCTEDIIHENDCTNGPLDSSHGVYSRYNSDGTPDKKFTQFFNPNADNGQGAYEAASREFVIKSNSSSFDDGYAGECQFACTPSDTYIYWKGKRKCTERVLYQLCGGNGPTSDTNVIYSSNGKYYKQTFDASLNYGNGDYTPPSVSFPSSPVSDPSDLTDCEYSCASNSHRYAGWVSNGRWGWSYERICADDPVCGEIEGDMSDTGWSINDEENLCTIGDDDDAADDAYYHSSSKQYKWDCTNKGKTVHCESDPVGCYGSQPPAGVAIRVDTAGSETTYTQHRVYPSEDDAKGHQCAWYCDESKNYFYLTTGGNEFCAKCNSKEAVHADEGWCENDNVMECEGNQVWNPDLKKCVAPGSCKYIPTNMVQSAEDLTPFYESAESINKRTTCKKTAAEVTPHQCEFSCPMTYVCNGDYNSPDCVKPYCHVPTGRLNVNAAGVYTGGIPTEANQTPYYLPANSYSDFISKVSNKQGCYYWCTGANLVLSDSYYQYKEKYENDPVGYGWVMDYNKCGSPEDVEGWENPETTYSCPSPYPWNDTYGPVRRKNTSDLTQDVTSWNRVEPTNYDNATEPCTWSCKSNYYFVYNEKVIPEHIEKGAPSIYCWKPCLASEIFTENGCVECKGSEGLKVDTSQQLKGNYIKCTDLCSASEGLAFSKDPNECKQADGTSLKYCCVNLYSDMVSSCDLENGCWLFDKPDGTQGCGCPADMVGVNN